MPLPQALHPTGHSKQFTGEGGEEGKPQAMPAEDAHANKTFFGKSGLLKASRPKTLGGSGNMPRNQTASAVQRARKRTK